MIRFSVNDTGILGERKIRVIPTGVEAKTFLISISILPLTYRRLVLELSIAIVYFIISIQFLAYGHLFFYSRKRSRAHTEVHVLQESPLKELQAGILP